jgi:dipeptidyl aminopeptidase/acylaminoacyl peptidase
MGLMVIHGDKDTSNPIEMSMKMAGAAKAAGVYVVYATVPGGEHLTAYLTFASEIFDFLDTQKKP